MLRHRLAQVLQSGIPRTNDLCAGRLSLLQKRTGSSSGVSVGAFPWCTAVRLRSVRQPGKVHGMSLRRRIARVLVALMTVCGVVTGASPAIAATPPSLTFANPHSQALYGAAYVAALDNLLRVNTVGYDAHYNKSGLMDPATGMVRAGGGYAQPWTRDASINSWNATSLLSPALARNTLWAVVDKDSMRRVAGAAGRPAVGPGHLAHRRVAPLPRHRRPGVPRQRLPHRQEHPDHPGTRWYGRVQLNVRVVHRRVVLQRRHRRPSRATCRRDRVGQHRQHAVAGRCERDVLEHQRGLLRRVRQRGEHGGAAGAVAGGRCSPHEGRRAQDRDQPALLEPGDGPVQLPAARRRDTRRPPGGHRSRVRDPLRRREPGSGAVDPRESPRDGLGHARHLPALGPLLRGAARPATTRSSGCSSRACGPRPRRCRAIRAVSPRRPRDWRSSRTTTAVSGRSTTAPPASSTAATSGWATR